MQLISKSCLQSIFLSFFFVMRFMEPHSHEEVRFTWCLGKLLPVSGKHYSLICTLGQPMIMLHAIFLKILKMLSSHIISACTCETMCNLLYTKPKSPYCFCSLYEKNVSLLQIDYCRRFTDVITFETLWHSCIIPNTLFFCRPCISASFL